MHARARAARALRQHPVSRPTDIVDGRVAPPYRAHAKERRRGLRYGASAAVDEHTDDVASAAASDAATASIATAHDAASGDASTTAGSAIAAASIAAATDDRQRATRAGNYGSDN